MNYGLAAITYNSVLPHPSFISIISVWSLNFVYPFSVSLQPSILGPAVYQAGFYVGPVTFLCSPLVYQSSLI